MFNVCHLEWHLQLALAESNKRRANFLVSTYPVVVPYGTRLVQPFSGRLV